MATERLQQLPELFVGPMVRHVAASQVTLWFITQSAQALTVSLVDSNDNQALFHQSLTETQDRKVRVGQSAYIHLVSLSLDTPLIEGHQIEYDILDESGKSLLPLELRYSPDTSVNFVYQPELTDVLHGSCRKPHGQGEDALLRVDDIIAGALAGNESRPSLVMMTGDQVYIDDVCGPMLDAIHQVIRMLGLFDEEWQGGVVNDSQSLYKSDASFYLRESLLPNCDSSKALHDNLFKWKEKPIFTSVNSHNHLVTVSEVIAMYCLVWSDALWSHITLSETKVAIQFQPQYQQELLVLNDFITGLGKVRRALSHISSYMILDDHDVTDDLNLTRSWEETAYGHPFSKRIIGNAFIGYLLCQGWGNQPSHFDSLVPSLETTFTDTGLCQQDSLIDTLLHWSQWHYQLQTHPPLVVLDTRTHRWRSESNPNKPSGLMDWESLTELQQYLIGHSAVIMVSAAPVYGVKFIEVVQRVFTFFGQALMVDAENWMAHPGTANVMLNMFKHPKTPPLFLILSGDVHYSFLYRVRPRKRQNLSILQITASGLKNTFPEKLLRAFEWCNRVFFAKGSPFVWLTKRRKMKVIPVKPNTSKQHTLVNQCAIGRVKMNWQTAEINVSVESRNNTVSFATQRMNE